MSAEALTEDEVRALVEAMAGDAVESEAVAGRLTTFLSTCLSFVTESANPHLAVWQLSFALGTDNCIGHTMTSKAAELQVTPACLSKGATKLCRMLEVRPSVYMLPVAAQDAYRKLRKTQELQRKAHA